MVTDRLLDRLNAIMQSGIVNVWGSLHRWCCTSQVTWPLTLDGPCDLQSYRHTALNTQGMRLAGWLFRKTIEYGMYRPSREDDYCTRGTTRTGQGAVAMTALQMRPVIRRLSPVRWRVPMTMRSQ